MKTQGSGVDLEKLPPLARGLLQAEAYPHLPQRVELRQTQMSFVFLADQFVFKIKKPVNLGFLDYTTLEKRKFFCQQEVLLNSRLCPQVYLGVAPVVQIKDRFLLGPVGEGEVVEYAVKMKRLPQERMMDELLVRGSVTKAMVEGIARLLARFHRLAPTSREISTFGDLPTVKHNWEENFFQSEKYVGSSLHSRSYAGVREFVDQFHQEKGALFQKRVRDGKIRDCHGDLHAAHVCLEDGICIYDCIEFNERFRYCDVASEIAFLAMDLDRYRQAELSSSFVDAYVAASQDEELRLLLDFYKCYRAYVRGKVESFKLDDPYISEGEKQRILEVARRYFELAHSYTGRRPTLFVFAGLMGTGKTAVAQALARRLGLEIISSDVVRKTMASIPISEHRFENFKDGIYSPEVSGETYSEMLLLAREPLSRNKSVILDASFKKREDRQGAKKLAQGMGASFLLIECTLEEKTVQQRLEKRLGEESPSDGRWELYKHQREDFDPVTELASWEHVILDTSRAPEDLTTHILKQGKKGGF